MPRCTCALHNVQLQCNVDELGGKSTEVIAELDLFSLRVNIALESTLVHRVQLQCNADEMEGKSTKAIAELDLSFQQVSIAEESVVDHQVQLQFKVNGLGGKSKVRGDSRVGLVLPTS